MEFNKPATNEFANYYSAYIDLVNEPESQLTTQINKLKSLINKLSDDDLLYKYAADKWSIKNLLVHCVDTERIMAYRLLCISRSEQNNLIGFDENLYADNSFADIRSIESIINEFEYLRRSNIELFNSLTEDQLNKLGTANNNEVSVRALIFIIIGHLEHHMNILISRYLNK